MTGEGGSPGEVGWGVFWKSSNSAKWGEQGGRGHANETAPASHWYFCESLQLC